MKRLLLYLVCSTAICPFIAGCTSHPEAANDSTPSKGKQAPNAQEASEEPSIRWDRVSRLKSTTAPADLHKVVNNALLSREKRAEAIFSLFANHVKVPERAAAVGKVLSAETWLRHASVDGVYAIGGWVPVEVTFEDTIFCLRLFPDKEGWSEWVIYFRLSGGSGRTADDAVRFLRGAEDLNGGPRLLEFALCFPAPEEQHQGYIERFTDKGIAVVP